jgi:hypothetical protein
MPITLSEPTTVTIDKLRIDLFSVDAQTNAVTIHFSRGYEDAGGNFVPKEFSRVDVKNMVFDPDLYSQVKDLLYATLVNELNAAETNRQAIEKK